jgi:asparagine synthase (glutamine-hydrolysing)
MCGIAGIWNRNQQPVEEKTLHSMITALRHRGPDDNGTWIDGELGLGHTRLSILDLSSRGHQPFVTSDNLGVLTYNGEIYNFRELRAQLEKEGVVFTSQSDTEVLLYALHHWGPEITIPLLNGMFAFAYLNRRRNELWLARDRFGIKPLFIAQPNQTLLFASEVKSLLCHPTLLCRPNMQALTAYVFSMRFQPGVVPFDGITLLQPGTYWRVTRDQIQSTTYFDVLRDLDVNRLLEAQRDNSGPLPVDEIESALSRSVENHLASDAPLAVLCSGGVDSSLITAFAHDHKPDVIGYVAHVEGIETELERARRVASHLGIRLRTVDIRQQDYLKLWSLAVWHGEHPTMMTNDIPLLSLCQHIRQDGVKVVLSGEGSDELFGGYHWQELSYRRWRAMRWHTRFLPSRWPFTLLRNVAPRLAPVDLVAFQKRPFWRLKDSSMFNTAYLATVDAGHRLSRQQEFFNRFGSIQPIEERAFLARCYDDLYDHLHHLLMRNDRMAMAASIETRVPFIENNVIDMALYLPRAAKWSNGVGKRVIKKIAAKRLPPGISYARKIGFDVPRTIWRPASKILTNGAVSSLFQWPSQYATQILKEVEEEPDVLFCLLGLELWARLYLSRETVPDLTEKLLQHAANN